MSVNTQVRKTWASIPATSSTYPHRSRHSLQPAILSLRLDISKALKFHIRLIIDLPELAFEVLCKHYSPTPPHLSAR